MKLSRSNKLSSFTLVETLIAMLISSIVIASVFSLLLFVQGKLRKRELYSSNLGDKILKRKEVLRQFYLGKVNQTNFDNELDNEIRYEDFIFYMENDTMRRQRKISEVERNGIENR